VSNNEKLKEIFDKYDKATDQVSKEFIDELKNDSKTYGDIYKKLSLFEKGIVYNNSKSQGHKLLICFFLGYIKELLDKEKNDLPLTNRSE